MYIIRKKYTVEYAHQLHDAFTKCCYETIHGHSGIIEIFLASDELDHNSMVIDFGEVSSIIKNYIMKTLDHALIIPKTFESEYIDMLKKYCKKTIIVDDNPTAEYFAESMFWDIQKILEPLFKQHKRVFKLWKIRFHETDTGYAEFKPGKLDSSE